jgi:hypothetical protein
MHAERFGPLALSIYGTAIAAQINDRSHTHFFQLCETLRRRLRAAKENIADFSGIWHAGDFQLFRGCPERSVGNGWLRRSLDTNLRKRDARTRGEAANCEKSFAQAEEKWSVHNGFDALVYSVGWMKSGWYWRSVRAGT